MTNANVDEAFEILLNELNAALIEVREMAIDSLRQGNYDVTQDKKQKRLGNGFKIPHQIQRRSEKVVRLNSSVCHTERVHLDRHTDCLF